MKFEYKIKGITLDVHDMYNICEYYEAYCTAEYIEDNYDVSEDEAIQLGYEVRRRMKKYGGEEEDVINDVMQEWAEEFGERTPSSTGGDYSPSNPWDSPGYRISDFIGGVN